MYSTRNYCVAC